MELIDSKKKKDADVDDDSKLYQKNFQHLFNKISVLKSRRR